MNISISENKKEMGRLAAEKGVALIQNAISSEGYATIILATGASQFEMLEVLVTQKIDWSKVEVFHLDEYIGISVTHAASFRKYLKERFVDKVGTLKDFHLINGDAMDLLKEIERLSSIIERKTIDVAFVGIGENGHLAFNDPPADFDISSPYLEVVLDQDCRKQQLGEGWFPSLEDVPKKAISMSVTQIMKSRHIINTVPDMRKAKAVANALTGNVTNLCPASILQLHKNCYWFLDKDSASLIPKDSVKYDIC